MARAKFSPTHIAILGTVDNSPPSVACDRCLLGWKIESRAWIVLVLYNVNAALHRSCVVL